MFTHAPQTARRFRTEHYLLMRLPAACELGHTRQDNGGDCAPTGEADQTMRRTGEASLPEAPQEVFDT
jgi:hypothetical protein